MIPFLFLLILSPESDTAQSRLDSLQVYNTYKSSIDILKNTTEPSDWYAVEDSLGRVAACALLRLSRFNKRAKRNKRQLTLKNLQKIKRKVLLT